MYGPTLQFTNVGGHYSLNIGVVTNIYLSTIESRQHGFSKRQVTHLHHISLIATQLVINLPPLATGLWSARESFPI